MDNWTIVEDNFDPKLLHQKETVFTIGNGYLSTRGAFEEGFPGDQAATLINGVYDDAPVVFTELVNTPHWPSMQLFAGGQRFSMVHSKIGAFQRALDLHSGILKRKVRWEIGPGQALEMEIERFSSLADEHLMAVRWNVRSEGYSGPLEFRAGLLGQVDTDGWVHWIWQGQGRISERSGFLQLQTRVTKIELAEAFSLSIKGKDAIYDYWDSLWAPELVVRVEIRPGEEVTAEKLIAVYTDRDVDAPLQAAQSALASATEKGYEELAEDSRHAWEIEWEHCNVSIEGDDRADKALRYNLFQLLIAAPRHDDRVSIPAKSLSGYGYHGHVFWDTEIFILPFFIYTRPEIARNLLIYRYRTLPMARQKAKTLGCEGALYAWESAATGAESTPRWVVGPDGTELVRIWPGDIEHHISADVAYAVYKYWHATGDDEYMCRYGAEILLDTAKFWASRACWDAEKHRYVIDDVIGPDENHDHVNNNAYTNLLARWNLVTAFQVLDWLKRTDPDQATALTSSLDLTQERLEHWKEVIDHIYQGFNPDSHLFEQFEGYFDLNDPPLSSFEPRSRSVQALLGIQGAQKVQIIKQPDVLMMLYLLENDFDISTITANAHYYTPRTDLTFGSSLGPAIQAAISARLGDLEDAYRYFMMGALTDLEDVRGNSVDGVHAATAGGVWQAAIFGFAGIDPNGGKPIARPRLPDGWERMRFQLQYRGEGYPFDLKAHDEATIPTKSETETPARQFPILGAIFDLDGVLTDTSELHYQGWKRLADEEGIPFTRQENESLRGIPRRASLMKLLNGRQVPEATLEEMMERKNRYYIESIQKITPADLLPGALTLLHELKQKEVRVAIGSASKNARAVIERLGIENLVDAISDGYSVERQKPAPDLFLHAAAQMQLPPGQCVVFEDAAAGVEAALAGGMWAVGIGPEERVKAADVVISNLEGVRWEQLIERLEHSDHDKSH